PYAQARGHELRQKELIGKCAGVPGGCRQDRGFEHLGQSATRGTARESEGERLLERSRVEPDRGHRAEQIRDGHAAIVHGSRAPALVPRRTRRRAALELGIALAERRPGLLGCRGSVPWQALRSSSTTPSRSMPLARCPSRMTRRSTPCSTAPPPRLALRAP